MDKTHGKGWGPAEKKPPAQKTLKEGETMLKLIDLDTINEIFTTTSVKIGLSARAIYIECLIHHFKNLPATTANSVAFEIYQSDFKGFDLQKKQLTQLQKAGLISVNTNTVYFNNVWGKYINRAKLAKSKPEEFIGAFTSHPVEFYVNDLLNHGSAIEVCKQKHQLNDSEVQGLMELFITEKKSTESTYQNYKAFLNDFYYYVRGNYWTVTGKKSKSKNTLNAAGSAASKLGIIS